MLPPWFPRPVPCLRLLPAAALVTWLLPATPAQAECTPDPAVTGDTVTCTATDTDGFAAGAGVDDLTVDVEAGADVSNAAGTDVIDLNDLNEVTVESTGEVNADGAAAISGGADNTVLNQGTITFINDDAAGIRLGNGANVVNEGTIGLTTGNNGVGIEIGNDGVLRNAGSISVGAAGSSGSVGIRMGNGNEGETAIPETTPPEYLLNSGNITVLGSGGIGIDAGNGNTFTNSAIGTVRATGANAIGVRLGTGNAFTNRGLIDANGDTARGIVSSNGNSIVNLGTIQVDVSDAMDLAILGGAGVDDVHNQGFIRGGIDLSDGNDFLRLYTGSILDPHIDMDPGVVAGGADTDELQLLGTIGSSSLDLDAVMDFETLRIDTETQWNLSGSASFSGGTTFQNGTIFLSDTVTLTNSSYDQQTGTTLRVQLDPVAGTNGQLVVDSAILAADTTLAIVQANPLLTSDTIPVLTAAGGIVGTFTNIPADTAVLDFSLIQTATQIQLDIVRQSYSLVGQTPNQEAVGDYLDELLLGSPSAGVNQALVLLDTFQAEELAAALDQLHPESYDMHTGALAAVGRTLAGIAARERLWCKPPLSELGGGRYQEEPCGGTGYSVWLDAVTGVHDRDTGSDWLESDGSTQALVAGMDWRPDRRVVVSAWAGLSSIDLDADDDSEGDIETYEFGISTLARVSGARARAAFGYGRGNHEHDRPIPFASVLTGIDRVARGEYDSNRVLGLLEAAWLFEFGGFSIEPQAELDVTWIQEEAFEEDGAGDLGLSLDERTNTLVSTAFGARLAYRHVQRAYVDPGPSWTQGVWTPEITGRWRSIWTGADREIDAHLLGDPSGSFTTEARDTEQGAEVGAHLTFHPHGGGGSVRVGYDGYFGDGGTAHRAGIELRLHF